MRKAAHPTAPDAVALHRALEQCHGVVRAKGQKNSEIRDAAARVTLEYDGHFTVDDLVKALRESGVADAHPATVYRLVPLLARRCDQNAARHLRLPAARGQCTALEQQAHDQSHRHKEHEQTHSQRFRDFTPQVDAGDDAVRS